MHIQFIPRQYQSKTFSMWNVDHFLIVTYFGVQTDIVPELWHNCGQFLHNIHIFCQDKKTNIPKKIERNLNETHYRIAEILSYYCYGILVIQVINRVHTKRLVLAKNFSLTSIKIDALKSTQIITPNFVNTKSMYKYSYTFHNENHSISAWRKLFFSFLR